MSSISNVGSLGSNNLFQFLAGLEGQYGSQSPTSSTNGASGNNGSISENLTITLNFNESGGSNTTAGTNSSSGATDSTDSSQGSNVFANLLSDIESAVQNVLQEFEANGEGTTTTSGSTSGSGSTTSGTTATTDTTTTTGTGTTGGTSSDGTTNSSNGSSSNSNATAGALQLLEQIFSAIGGVLQQNGLGGSQAGGASGQTSSSLAGFLGQNGLTTDQFSQGLFASLQQNGGAGFSLAQIFQNASPGQNVNVLA
jgi:hypothetical protein